MTVYNYIIVSLKDGEADAVIASGTLIARSEESARAKASVTHADGLVSLDDFNVIVRKF